MTYCQHASLDTCYRAAVCVCANCGVNLCRQHSYFCRGEFLCGNCYNKLEGCSPLEICYLCGKSENDPVVITSCERCGRLVCTDCLVLYAIELKNPGEDLNDFDGARNDVRGWCQPCVDKWKHPLFKPAFP